MRVTERGKEAWSETAGRWPMDRNRIKGGADQGDRASDREALVTKGRYRKSGGRAGKECVLPWAVSTHLRQ